MIRTDFDSYLIYTKQSIEMKNNIYIWQRVL